MAKMTLSVSIDQDKLDALIYFMGKEKKSPQKELEQMLQKLYEDCVPADTREYIERRAPTPAASRPKRQPKSAPSVPREEVTENGQP